MLVRELAAKLGLEADLGAFLKAGSAIEVLRLGLDAAVNAAVGLATQFGENIKTALEYGDELHDTSQALGESTDALQENRYAASLSGVAAGDMDLAVKFLSRNLREAASGSGDAGKAFEKLGIRVKDTHGKLRSSDDVMGDLAEKLSALPDGTEKTALAMQFFGRSGQRLIPMLNEGRDGLAAMRKEAHDLGLVMGKESIDAADELGDNMRRLKAVSEGLWRGAIAPLIPAISDLVKQFLAWRKANAEVLRQRLQQVLGFLVSAVRTLGTALGVVTNTIKFMTEHWQGLLVVLGGVAAVFALIEAASVAAAIKSAAAWAAAALPFTLIAGAIAGVMLFLDDLEGYKAGKDSVFGRYKKAIDEWLKPHVGDPWWLAAIRELVGAMREALGLADKLGLASKGRTIAEVEKAAAVGRGIWKGGAHKTIGGGSGAGTLSQIGVNPFGGIAESASRDDRWTAAREQGLGWWDALKYRNEWGDAKLPASGGGSTVTQQNTFQITQQPGEDGERFAQRVAEIVRSERNTEYESSAAAIPASGY